MKKTVLAFLSVLFATVAWAGPYGTVSVELNDGTKVDITMSEKLSLSFSGSHLIVGGSDADVEIPKEKILAFRHLEYNAVNEMGKDAGVEYSGRSMRFTGLGADSRISVFDLKGNCLRSAEASGDYELSLEGLAPAVYVVRVNGMSYKIAVR